MHACFYGQALVSHGAVFQGGLSGLILKHLPSTLPSTFSFHFLHFSIHFLPISAREGLGGAYKPEGTQSI